MKYAITLKEMIDLGKQSVDIYPLKNPLWYPGGGITANRSLYFANILICHILPAIFIDFFLKIAGHKPMSVTIHFGTPIFYSMFF